MESVLAQVRTLALRGNGERPARMTLVENTAAAVAAQFSRSPLDGPWLQVVLRDPPEVISPFTGNAVERPPTAVLTQGRTPLAMLVDELLIVSRTAPRCIRVRLIREARERLLDHEQVRDDQLLKLVAGYEPAVLAAGAASSRAVQCASGSGGASRR
jgi:hypothetical protein